MKSTIYPSEHALERDPSTGAAIHRLTSAACINHATYFLQSSLTPDGSTLIFTSYRTGSAQLFSIEEFPHGPIRQWTDGDAIHPFSPAIDSTGQQVYFVRSGSVWSIQRQNLEERLIARFEGAQLGEVSLSADGEWLTAAAKQGSQSGLVVGRTDGTDWRLIPFPRTVIHPQFHPLDPEWIEFAGDPAPRMHRVRRDGTRLECLYEHGNDEFVVHETFLGRTGDLVYTVWPFALWRMNWETREHHRICEFNAWHITPNRAGTLVLCDTNHPDLGLFLIDAATGARQPICQSQASSGGTQWLTSRYALAEDFAAARSAAKSGALSWMEVSTDTVYGPQWTHPHPSFSPDEQLVIFTSDRTGHPQVYAAEVPAS
ncbi:oligogalacturonate lyase family protein [Paludibaculum fermentans]|uniref:PD40 domain-containing protein n=1 Tax=Paludibaculum fermentans TaxID=1473598 RepID=A0A7S7NN88_PALFE|nr:oligogalacturonate lyase family protein [Paludibaculum fermentans]QOY86757.1 PD40 domain-containing protein [Paludibaculum fermentans]